MQGLGLVLFDAFKVSAQVLTRSNAAPNIWVTDQKLTDTCVYTSMHLLPCPAKIAVITAFFVMKICCRARVVVKPASNNKALSTSTTRPLSSDKECDIRRTLLSLDFRWLVKCSEVRC